MIYTYEEYLKIRKKKMILLESYEVNYWINGIKKKDIFYAPSKSSHEDVKKKFISVHKQNNVSIISVIYQ